MIPDIQILDLDPGAALQLADIEVCLVGAGRSGSMAALVLAMLGVRVRTFDGERLADENLGKQLYRKADVEARRHKVRALRSLVRSIVPWAEVRAHAENFEARPEQPCSPLVVLCVDTMAERRRLWERLARAPWVVLLLDLRLGRGLVRLNEVRPADPESVADYEASLHDDPDADAPGVCNEEASAHAAAAGAALLGGAVCAYVEGLARPRWIALDLNRGLWAAGSRHAGVTFEDTESSRPT
jgi:hypothetical protein